MTALVEIWLEQATRHLAKDSVEQVRTEIREHYELAFEAALSDGATDDLADKLAVAVLGNAKIANRQYCEVLLTSAEAEILGEGNWEARTVCSRAWLKWLLIALPIVALSAAAALFLKGSITLALDLLMGGIGTGVFFAASFLPVYTHARSRVLRFAKWVVMLGNLVLVFGPNPQIGSWLLISCLWPFFRIEWTRSSIRRKLPIANWPKQLYL